MLATPPLFWLKDADAAAVEAILELLRERTLVGTVIVLVGFLPLKTFCLCICACIRF